MASYCSWSQEFLLIGLVSHQALCTWMNPASSLFINFRAFGCQSHDCSIAPINTLWGKESDESHSPTVHCSRILPSSRYTCFFPSNMLSCLLYGRFRNTLFGYGMLMVPSAIVLQIRRCVILCLIGTKTSIIRARHSRLFNGPMKRPPRKQITDPP